MKKIRDVISEGEVTEEDAKKIAAQWINIADVDGDGLIDFQEFKDFMAKIENESDEKSSDEHLKQIFDSIDENNNGQLDEEEFGKALFQCLKGGEDEEQQE